MAGQKITIEIKGDATDAEDVRLPDLIEHLQSLKRTLAFAERDVPDDQRAPVYYRVIDLKHDSPALLTVEPVPLDVNRDPTNLIVAKFRNRLREIESGSVPADVSLDELQAFRALAPRPDRHVREVNITVAAPSILKERVSEFRITEAFDKKIADILGPDEVAWGSLTGRLEVVNLHRTNAFNLYPRVGATKVTCIFNPDIREDVKHAIDHYVEVFGLLRYKQRYNYPHAMTSVHHVEVLDKNLDTAPLLSELRGIAPDATLGMDARDFLDSFDEEEW
jgi:hypothetical protein